MSALVTNQAQMRWKITSGSPKKKAAWRSLSNRKGGMSPGAVSACHTPNTTTSTPSCQTRRLRMFGLIRRHMVNVHLRSQLLPIALQHLFAQHVPDRLVQLDEARRGAHLGHVARAVKVDMEF